MKISFFLVLLFFCTQMFWAQRTLFNQKYQSLAQDFQLSQEQLDAYRGEGRLEIFNEVKHKTSLTEKLIKANVGKTIKFNRGYEVVKFRVLAKSMLPHYRVRYIFINKNKFDDQEHFDAYLKKVRDLLSKTEFESVAMQYSMDYKLPLMKRLFKGMMPKSCTIYYSSNAYRIEAEMSILGMNGKIVDICNYTKMESIYMMNISGKKGSKEIDTSDYQTNKILIDLGRTEINWKT